MDKNMGDLRRTHMCGNLRMENLGEEVDLMGWVQRRRDLGALLFVTLRDRSGIIQVVFNSDTDKSLHDKAINVRS